MSLTVGVPDRLSQMQLARAHAQTKRDLLRAQTEVATGVAQDTFKATGGDPGRLLALDRSLARIDSRAPMIAMARTRAAATQTALGEMATAAGDLGARLLAANREGTIEGVKMTGAEAEHALGQVIRALNTSVGGRALFAGAKAEGPAITVDARAFVDAAVDALRTDPDTFDAAMETFFSEQAYGGEGDAPPVELGDNDRLAYALRGDDTALKSLMKTLALAAAVADSEADPEEMIALYDKAGARLISANDDLIALRAGVGLSEQRIGQAQTRAAAERATLEQGRAEMIGRDPYEAATELTQIETQLQMIYSITARAANLSLLSFLR